MRDGEIFLGDVGILKDFPPDIIKAFKRPHTRCSDGDGFSTVSNEFFDGLPPHADVFAVHFVAFDGLAFHGFERSCANVQRHFLAYNSLIVNRL